MNRPMIVIADSDERYLASLELKLIEEYHDKVDLEVITDQAYFESFFSVPRTVELLAVQEEWYQSSLLRHDIDYIFLLCERPPETSQPDAHVHRIFKYTSIRDIYNEMMHVSQSDLLKAEQNKKQPQVIMAYSAAGGAGKTTVAAGIAACLAESYSKVLYIDAEYIQNFQFLMQNQKTLPNSVCKEFKADNDKIYLNIKNYICTEGFDYVPPFCAAISSLNIRFEGYIKLIQMAKSSNDYAYIIVDLDSVFNEEKAQLLGLADKVLVVARQDAFSVYKTELLAENIDCGDREKYFFVCNAYQRDEENSFLNHKKLTVHQYIGTKECGDWCSVKELVTVDAFHKLALMLE